MSVRTRLAELFTDRWQIPLALAALVVGGVTLHRLVPTPPARDFAALLADVTLLEEAGDSQAAANAVANLLELEPPLPPKQQAVLHDRFATLVFEVERGQPAHDPGNARALVEHQEAAWTLGAERGPDAELRFGLAHAWLGQDTAALEVLRPLLSAELPADARREVRKTVVEILRRHPGGRAERTAILEQVLADPATSDELVWWGLQQAIKDALDEQDAVRARQLFELHGDRLTTSDVKGYADYLDALILLHEGRAGEAEPIAHWIDDWLGSAQRTARALDAHGDLPSLNQWLLGRIHLVQARPQAALEAFEQVLTASADAELRIAASIGKGEALAALERHAAALDVFRDALADVDMRRPDRRRAMYDLRQAMLALHERLADQADPGPALRYLELAVELTPAAHTDLRRVLHERLAAAYRRAAESAAKAARARQYWAAAGDHFERASALVEYDEPRTATLLWNAAEAYDESGLMGALRRVLQEFVRGRSDAPRMPAALLKLGQANEALGTLAEAEAVYGALIERYPELDEAIRARVLRAGLRIAQGREHHAEAERSLAELLDGPYVEPDAPDFRDALLMLCELLYHQGRYGEAIGRLENFLTLYPRDPERTRAAFMIADAYRRSAHELTSAERGRTAPPAAQATARARLATAAARFAALLREIDGQEPGAEADEAVALYTRLALFYRGDCLFELNEPDTLREALATYRSAAARYAGQPAALAAHVQIANIHLRRGEVVEAARAIEKARWLLRSIPDGALSGVATGTRAEWERFLHVVSSSDLFSDVFVNPQ